jgi:hypothetical protein
MRFQLSSYIHRVVPTFRRFFCIESQRIEWGEWGVKVRLPVQMSVENMDTTMVAA